MNIIDQLKSLEDRLPGDAGWSDVDVCKKASETIQTLAEALLYAEECIRIAEAISGNRFFIGGEKQINNALGMLK